MVESSKLDIRECERKGEMPARSLGCPSGGAKGPLSIDQWRCFTPMKKRKWLRTNIQTDKMNEDRFLEQIEGGKNETA